MEIMSKKEKGAFQLDSNFIEIPSADIQLNEKRDWLIRIFTTPIHELPETVQGWRNNLIAWLKKLKATLL